MSFDIRGCGGIGINVDDYLDMDDSETREQIEQDQRVLHLRSGIRDASVSDYLLIPGQTFLEVLQNKHSFLEAINEITEEDFSDIDLMVISEGYMF